MKVIYFTRGQSPHDLRFTKALAETDHQVFVLCLEPVANREWPQGIYEIAWPGIDLRHGWLGMRRGLKELNMVLSTMKPDLVHAGPIQSAAHLAALGGFHPLVSMSWGSDLLLEADRNEIQRRITRFTLTNTDVLVGDCDAVGQKAASFGFDLKNYKQFPWGVDLQHFQPKGSASLRQKLDWQNKTVFLSTRAFEPVYGVDIVINAFATAIKDNPDLRLLLFGRGSLEYSIRQAVKAFGLEDTVHFGGMAKLDELPDIYRSADLYLSASHVDGSSVSLMEALASGLPVVVSDIPGNLEWIVDGENGWLFKDGDAANFSTKLLLAASQIEKLDEIKKRNRVVAENRANWEKNFQVLLEGYTLALEKAGKHA